MDGNNGNDGNDGNNGNDSELASYLRGYGLDNTEFWMEQLREELGVESKASLANIEQSKTAYNKLKVKVRHAIAETKALRRLLKIDELEEREKEEKQQKAKEKRAARKEKAKQKSDEVKKELKEREEKSKAMLKELEEARKEGKTRHDERVQKLESEMREHLKISPESWISKDKSLEETIKMLESHHNASGELQKREWLCEKSLLETCSGGQALQGILLTSNIDDQLENRSQLLQVPENVLITGASESKNITEQFTSTHQEDKYKKTVDVLGHGVSVSASAPVYGGVTLNAGVSTSRRTEDEETHQQNVKELYSSTVKYSALQVASYHFKKKDLMLSEDAIDDLKKLSTMLKVHGAANANVEETCKQFLRTYGSHVNKGPLFFGGQFWWTCSSKGFSKSDTKTVKKMQSHALTTSAGFAFGGFGVSTEVSMEKTKAQYKGQCTADTLASSSLEVKIKGGPPEATDLSLWKNGLVANNSTWVLTDRGNKFLAIWDIIRMNYEKEFGNVKKVLRSTWEKMTGLKAELDLLDVLAYDSGAILEEIESWCDQKMTPRQLQGNIEYLLKVKNDIITNTANPDFWISEYLCHYSLQDFVLSIISNNPDSSHLDHTKYLLQQLMEEEQLKQLSARDFPDIEEVSKWLYESSPPAAEQDNVPDDISNFDSFADFLKNVLDESRLADLEGEISPEKLAVQVSKGVRRLRSHFHQSYEDTYISILIYPFIKGNFKFSGVAHLKPMQLRDLQNLYELFIEQSVKFNDYKTKHLVNLQAYLFHLAVSQLDATEESEFLRQVEQEMKRLDPDLKHVRKHLKQRFSMGQLKETMHSLMDTEYTPQQHSASSMNGIHSLKKVLETPHFGSWTEVRGLSLMCNPKACSLMERLGLCESYINRLQLKDALCIRQEPLELSISETPPSDAKQLPYVVLHRLMSYDIKCRSDLMPSVHESQASAGASGKASIFDDDDDDDEDKPDDNKKPDAIHPVDSLLALILCCDNFLCHDLFSRLAKCQLAIPFLLPDPFTDLVTLPLWALRSIIKEWKCKNALTKEVVQKTQPIIDYGMPIVSFIRIGKRQGGASKSKIMNDIMSDGDSQYNHYFHRDCPGGQNETLLGDGLVDMCWYLPSGKPADAFPDAVTFLNLHGDARKHVHQCKFLSQISSVCFLLLGEEILDIDSQFIKVLEKFNSTPGGIVILNDVNKKPEVIKSKIPKVPVIKLATRNAATLKDHIRIAINSQVFSDTKKKFPSIEKLCDIKEDQLLVDESSDLHSKGLKFAVELKKKVIECQDDKPNFKDIMVPLQGSHLWKAWASLDKELHRQVLRGRKSVNHYVADIRGEKTRIRKKQLRHVGTLTPVMESFIISLLKLEGPSNRVLRNYFFQCLKLELNSLSRDSISGMQQQYHSTRKQLSLLQNASDPQTVDRTAKIDDMKKKLESLQEDIIDSSFGLEHLLRELGQVYEAAKQSKLCGDKLSRLPRAAAELLIEGYPLELMDGDAAHVPLEWVTDVLKQAVEILGDPRVFVLSVLGLQSTGKSTMLNTAFGLQFNVSAGRCTRGAFMQLLELDEDLRNQSNCRYVLIVDTEGLRAPELDTLKTQKHDNELATFVIGLANMTLINIYGEVAGDINDILQTSVHAFLRMTQVKYKPSCQFIHQNAGANLNSEVGRAKFTKTLNEFTQNAAMEENCVGKYKSFNDVIKFDDQTDVHHFPGLWKGDPPMAPVNHGYSNAAQLLKKHFIANMCKRAGPSGTREMSDFSLSSFHVRVNDLWNTLLKEKFVFSFKNTLEITAYNALESEFSKWNWQFQKKMIDWEEKAENEIKVAAEEDAEKVPNLVKQRCKDLHHYVTKVVLEPLKTEMEDFFSGKQSETLAQWKAKFERRLDEIAKELQLHAKQHCIKLGESIKAISTFERDKKDYAATVTQKVQDLIKEIRKEQESLNESLKNRTLKQEQLEKLLEKKMFTSENLTKYRERKIIAEDEVREINGILQSCDGQLTSDGLKKILVGGILSNSQVKKILKLNRQSERELNKKFEDIWIELISKLPSVSRSSIDVQHEVEERLIDFVTVKGGYDGQFVDKMQKVSSLKKWGGFFYGFLPEEKVHYDLSKTKKFQRLLGGTDVYQQEAFDLTQRVFNKAKQQIQDIVKRDTDFNPSFTHELLREVHKSIEEESSTYKHLTFKPNYKHEVYLIACGFAVTEFEKMAESFKKRNDPQVYLEAHIKGPLFTKFKNQYQQTEAEEAIASTLCAYLEGPVRVQIGNKLPRRMVDIMKDSQHHFSSKMALKVKILSDLYKERKFSSFIAYITKVKDYIEEKIKDYTIHFCDDKVSEDQKTRLQVMAEAITSELVNFVEGKVTDLNKTDITEWLSTFCSDEKLKSELGLGLKADDLLSGHTLHELNLENFKFQIRHGLSEMKTRLHASFVGIKCETEMAKWKNKPHVLLGDLVGCTEPCPFCKEQCDLLQPDHLKHDEKHRVEIHRPDCLAGWRLKNVLTVDFCPAEIRGKRKFFSSTDQEYHYYKDYQDVYPDWTIPSDNTSEGSLYWLWFVSKYKDDLKQHYNAEPPQIHGDFLKYSWDELENDLKKVYHL